MVNDPAMSDHIPVLILGAGLAGLSCAYHLRPDYLLAEREQEPGGIVRTRVRLDSFLCDGTGHWLHLRNDTMKKLVNTIMAGQMIEYERRAVIYSKGTFTAYPFQANTYGLPRDIVLECLLGLLKAKHPEDFGAEPDTRKPQNFHEWIVRYFGEGISKHFMVPYNEKLLGVNLTELMPEYAERFIPRPSTEDVIKGALGFSRESLGYNAKFIYPKHGGIGALSRRLAEALPKPPTYRTQVTRVNLGAHTAALSDGRTIRFDALVNTAALVRFVEVIEDAPPEVRAAAQRLRATTVHYFDLGVRGTGAVASHYHWVYFPEPEFIFYRAGSYSAVHRDAAPPGCRSYYIEMSGGANEWLSDIEGLKQRVLTDLKRAQILADDDEILFMELCEIPYAYVIFDQHYESSRRLIFDYLLQHGVQSCGRWGGWGYGGMEDALLDGKTAAETIDKQKT